MKFSSQLIHGTLIKRYKRFLADIKLDDGSVITAHCTNSGSMKSCLQEGADVYLSYNNNPKRKTRHTWEMIKINKNWVGVNTNNPNLIAYEALIDKSIARLGDYNEVIREVTWRDSRFDIYARNNKGECFIEVKNVTYKNDEYAMFPDAVTARGLKHLKTLVEAKKEGYRAIMLYIIQRIDVKIFSPAKHIDPEYAEMLKTALNNGVEIIPLLTQVTPSKINIVKEIPYEL